MTQARAASKIRWYWMLLLFCAVFVIVVPYVLNAVQAAREAVRRTAVKNNLGHGDPVADTRTLIAMRAHFPIVPLGERLMVYSQTDGTNGEDTGRSLSSDGEQLLIQLEDKAKVDERLWALGKLHDEAYAEFVEKVGFGRGRMWYPLKWDTILVAESPSIPLPNSTTRTEWVSAC